MISDDIVGEYWNLKYSIFMNDSVTVDYYSPT